jgi:hypothetical protein
VTPGIAAIPLGRRPRRVYSQALMRSRLLIRLLVTPLALLLGIANSGATSMCTACCMPNGSARHAAAQPSHQMESQPHMANASASISRNMPGHMRRGHSCGRCPACPSAFGARLNHKADCASRAPVEVLKEGAFRLDAPRAKTPVDMGAEPAGAVGAVVGPERFSTTATFQPIGIFDPALIHLRI